MSGQQITASRHDDRDDARAGSCSTRSACAGSRSTSCARCRWSSSSRSAARRPTSGPVKDGRSLPRDPFDPDAPPLSAHIPMILGNTHDETRTLIGRGDPSLFALTWETLLPKLEAQLAVHGHARSRPR